MTVFFVALILLTALMNGLTDAPSSVSSCVFTRSMTPSSAFLMASICNFAGGLLTTLLAPRVARTVYFILRLQKEDESAMAALCAGTLAVVIWSVITFALAIPISYTHSLMAGISGASFAVRMSTNTANTQSWIIMAAGFLISTFSAFFVSKLLYSRILKICSGIDRRKALEYFMRTRRRSGAFGAFMHGAQDTQKIVGIFMLGLSLTSNGGMKEDFKVPVLAALGVAFFMSFGIILGGSRIIKTVGVSMVDLDAIGATAADFSSSVILFICTLFGVPISTAQSKICAIIGAGLKTPKGVNIKVFQRIVLIWLITVPVCAVMGFFLSLLIARK